MTLEEARVYFANDRYATVATGAVIEEVGENYAKVSLVLNENHCNAVGHVMGGVMFTLADFVFAIATNSPEQFTVTVTSQISYVAATRGHQLFAECHVVKEGRSNCFYRVDVTDDLGALIAVVNVCGKHMTAK